MPRGQFFKPLIEKEDQLVLLKAIKHFNSIRGYGFNSNMTKNVELPLQNDGEYSIGEYDFK